MVCRRLKTRGASVNLMNAMTICQLWKIRVLLTGGLFSVCLALILAGGGMTGCGQSNVYSRPVPSVTLDDIAGRVTANQNRVCVIGVDALTWDILKPMMRGDELPNIKRLLDRGVSGEFSPADDRLYSPRIWTSIATGKTADKHGIEFFLINPHQARHSGKTAGSDLRNCLAVWNILSHFKKKVHVSNYMVTWPAEKINGTILSDYFYMERGTWPASLQPVITERYMAKTHRDLHAQRLIDRLCPWYLGADQTPGLSRGETIKMQNFLTCMRRDELTLDKSLEMIAEMPPDLSLIYLRSVDIASHFYWKYSQLPKDDPRLDGLEQNVKRFGGIIPEMYRWADEAVGRIVSTFPEDTTYILISDHGFKTYFNDLRGYNLMKIIQETGIGMYSVGSDSFPVVTDTADPIDSVRRLFLIEDRVDAYSNATGIPRNAVITDILERLAALRTDSDKALMHIQPLENVRLMNQESVPDGAVKFNLALTPGDTLTRNGRTTRIDRYIQFLEQSGNHDSTATIIIAGPHVSRGGILKDATALDITPTVLALMDMPVADDMDGAPLVRAFESGTWERHPLTSIDTYEGKIAREVQVMPAESRPQIIQELKAIGYIQ